MDPRLKYRTNSYLTSFNNRYLPYGTLESDSPRIIYGYKYDSPETFNKIQLLSCYISLMHHFAAVIIQIFIYIFISSNKYVYYRKEVDIQNNRFLSIHFESINQSLFTCAYCIKMIYNIITI